MVRTLSPFFYVLELQKEFVFISGPAFNPPPPHPLSGRATCGGTKANLALQLTFLLRIVLTLFSLCYHFTSLLYRIVVMNPTKYKFKVLFFVITYNFFFTQRVILTV